MDINTMDPVVHHNPPQSTLSLVSSTRRRGARENETPAQRQKREKAAERQRRKRERDRHVNNLNAAMTYTQPAEPPPPPQPQPPPPLPQAFASQEFSPEELARRERVRAAARERQRKHRSLVKQRKMRELGLDMTGEMMPGIEEVQFRVNGQNEFQVLPHELAHPHPMNPQDPSFPQPPLSGGQSFASALMLSFSCTQLLKQQLLRTLSISTEDLVALESIIAEAFDHWDNQRRLHFAAAKAADGSLTGPAPPPFPDMSDPSANGFGEQPSPNDFRARFHRSLAVPSPFRNFNPAESTTATTSTPTSTPGSGPPSDPIDPHLSGVVIAATDGRQEAAVDTTDTDSVVGQ